jgi:histidinol phosphatase-like enzyme
VDALTQLAGHGFRFIVVSNQAGIARGSWTRAWWPISTSGWWPTCARGVDVMAVCCPHHWDEHCRCRKPEAGLFFDARVIISCGWTAPYG